MAATYRILNTEELNELEKEFIDFLVVNGITADDWVRIKENHVEEAHRMIELFSDVVFEGIMRKTQFLEIRTSNDIKTFQCLKDKIILMGIEGPETIDFSQDNAIEKYLGEENKSISIYTQEKEYNKKRELEIFEMTNNGCQISDGKLFKALSLAYYSSKT